MESVSYKLLSFSFNEHGVIATLKKDISIPGCKTEVTFCVFKNFLPDGNLSSKFVRHDNYIDNDKVVIDGKSTNRPVNNYNVMDFTNKKISVSDNLRQIVNGHFNLKDVDRPLIFDKKFQKYMKLQRNHKGDYTVDNLNQLIKSFHKNIEIIDKYSNNKSINRVLDIGCGLGVFDLAMDIYYRNKYGKRLKFYLLDRTTNNKEDKEVYYGFNENGTAFYNNLDFTREFLETNDIPSYNIINLYADKDKEKSNLAIKDNIHKVDIVVSLISWGFHYSINYYLDTVLSVLSDGGLVCFNIRELEHNIPIVKEKLNIIHPSDPKNIKNGDFIVCKAK